ncbi:UNVERIFIED_ORG: leucyl aminopeptidase [Nocardia globerula]|uniref:Probable cytosol aminopeptidase n=1 Tax=Nocardia globerula TaxID=1818 RepID=A0A652YYC4_NOCGL|nr:leucyl aminopeptidase [Rhodococcus globerulus]
MFAADTHRGLWAYHQLRRPPEPDASHTHHAGDILSTRTARSLGPDLVLAGKLGKRADVLVVGLTSGPDGPELALSEGIVDEDVLAEVLDSLIAVGATGKPEQLTRIPAPSDLPVVSVLAVGLGSAEKLGSEQIRKSAGAAARALSGIDTAATTLSALDLAAAVEGFALGAYTFTEFKSSKSAPGPDAQPLARVELLVPSPRAKETKATLTRSAAIAEAVATAREFVNTPPSHLYPAEFADRAKALGIEAGLTVQILDEKALAKGGYGGILGVGKGSSRQPRLVRMEYASKKRGASKVALVGKGITFDTGGISIKPAAGMENMTSDMGGAAAVIATVVLAAKLGLPVNVVAYIPMAENMPSATAQRPGDVLTQYGGITVEVINTDAEGRLVLADAMVRAGEDNPDYMIDTATLTGAQMVALGNRTPGVMGTDDFRDRVASISQSIGENAWAMPLPEELRGDLDSKVADMANVTPHRWGGMLAAAHYLKEFVPEGVQWAHIDVAGPAYNTSGPWGYTGKGGTGVPVRTMISVLEDISVNG